MAVTHKAPFRDLIGYVVLCRYDRRDLMELRVLTTRDDYYVKVQDVTDAAAPAPPRWLEHHQLERLAIIRKPAE